MLVEVKEFIVAPIGKTPSLEDCKKAVNLAIENACFIRMRWCVKHSGDYTRLVGSSDDAIEIFNNLPRVYAV